MIGKMEERVYVVPRVELFDESAPHGFVPGIDRWMPRIRHRGHFAPRSRVEEDPSLKQIIPYALIVRGDEIFCVQRTTGGGERRLHGLKSIGVGGHVNPIDKGNVVGDALRRELAEEVVLPSRWGARLTGLLNDDTTAVGSVHVGVVAVVEIDPDAEVKVREAETMTGSFMGRPELREMCAADRESFESWSALLIDRLDEVIAWEPQPGAA
jgi:predicted NUDIX family phosphoesterase